jgi:hypothetical protein
MNQTEKIVVQAAYSAGFYIDNEGKRWRKGMDGWFLDNVDGKGGVLLVRHHDMESLIIAESHK